MPRKQWNLSDVLPGGHRLFRTPSSSSVYIADESGANPDLTDDGPLALDTTEPIQIDSTCCLVPVLDTTGGDPFRVPVTVPDALWLSDRFSWPLKTSRASSMYRAVRVAD
jgi:hypothetical protein